MFWSNEQAMFENYWYIATCLSDERNGKVSKHIVRQKFMDATLRALSSTALLHDWGLLLGHGMDANRTWGTVLPAFLSSASGF